MTHMRNRRREARKQRVRRQVIHTVTLMPDGATPTGRIVGFSTLTPETPETTLAATPTIIRPKSQHTSSAASELDVDTTAPSTTLRTTRTSSSSSNIPTASDYDSSSDILATASSSSGTSASATGIGADSSTSSGSLTGGATIGIVVGSVLVAALLLLLGFFLYRRKQRQRGYGKTDDEKSGLSGAGALPGRRRPISDASIRSTSSSFISAPPAPTVFTTSVEDKQEEKLPAPPPPGTDTLPSGAGSIERKNIPKRLSTLGIDVQRPIGTLSTIPASPSPSAYTEFSATPVTPNAPVAPVAPGAPGIAVAAPVHRVQMDYTPSMDDELLLRTGQLVRIIHEYDDGWALCIRLDRAEQGVCPRTCLSQRPLKPRNRNGPPVAPRGVATSSSSPRSPNGLPASPRAGKFPASVDCEVTYPLEQPENPGRNSFSRPTTPTTYPGKREYKPSPPATPTTPTITVSPFDDSAETSSESSVPSVLKAGNAASKPSPLSRGTTGKEEGLLEKEFYHAM